MSEGTFNALMAGYDSGEEDDEPEDLMAGRTVSPRMSDAQRASLKAGAKNLMDKRKDKKLFMDEGGTKEEYRGLRREMLKNKKRKDLGLDTDTEEEMESIEAQVAQDVEGKKGGLKLKIKGKEKEQEQEAPEEQETTPSTTSSTTRSGPRNPLHHFSVGGKILKKYAKGGETDPPKKELTAQQERFIKDLAGKELDAWMNPRDKDKVYGHDSKGNIERRNMLTGERLSKGFSYKKGQTKGEAKKLHVERSGGREEYIQEMLNDPEYRARLEKKLPDYGKPAKTWTPNIKIKKAKR